MASDITILAGKNESGKSSALDAINAFLSVDQDPLDVVDKTAGTDRTPAFEAEFTLTLKDRQAIQRAFGSSDLKETSLRFESAAEEDGQLKWTISGPVRDELGMALKRASEESLVVLAQHAGQALERHTGQKLEADLSADDLVSACEEAKVPSEEISPMAAELARYKEVSQLLTDVESFLFGLIPPVILFRTFEDELPDSIDPQNPEQVGQDIIQDFCRLTGLDLRQLLAADKRSIQRTWITEQSSNLCTDSFGRFWTQEKLEIEVKLVGSELQFSVKGPGQSLSHVPSQRSKGLKWYLSFFITLTAGKGQDDPAIILIDEPGLYLHAKAQEDLLLLLEAMAHEGSQVIIATHSPYLLDARRMDRVRLVVKNDTTKTTRVCNNWYGSTDPDTLTPVMTAIGVDVSKMFPGLGEYNVVIEGPADYYVLSAIRTLLEKRKLLEHADVVFVPCMGHAKAGVIVSFLMALGRECAVLLDKKGTKHTAQLLISHGFPPGRLVRAGLADDESMIDLLDPEDIRAYVHDGVDLRDQKPSRALKSVEGTSETLLARRFFDAVIRGDVVELRQTTETRFQALLQAIYSAVGGGTDSVSRAQAAAAVDPVELLSDRSKKRPDE